MSGSILSQIQVLMSELPSSERKVAQYIVSYPNEVIRMNIKRLAENAETSGAAVIRFCHSLGLDGFPELKVLISAESVKAPFLDYYDIEPNESVETVIEKTIASSVQVIRDTSMYIDLSALREAVNRMKKAPAIYTYGVGASGIIAEDIAQKWMRLGKNIFAVKDHHVLATILPTTQPDTLFFGISYSGETSEVVNLMRVAKESGVHTMGLCRFGEHKISPFADVLLYTPRAPEAKLRSAATSSRLAQLIVIDILFFTYASAQYDETIEQLSITHEAIKSMKK